MKKKYIKPCITLLPLPLTILSSSGQGEIGTGDDIANGESVWGDSKRHDIDLTDFKPFQYEDE